MAPLQVGCDSRVFNRRHCPPHFGIVPLRACQFEDVRRQALSLKLNAKKGALQVLRARLPGVETSDDIHHLPDCFSMAIPTNPYPCSACATA